jgi:plasmid stability protein
MRTTLNLDDSLLDELRRRGAREGKSIGMVASEALARGLVEDESTAAPPEWTCRDLGEPYVDIDDKDALRAVLDGQR